MRGPRAFATPGTRHRGVAVGLALALAALATALAIGAVNPRRVADPLASKTRASGRITGAGRPSHRGAATGTDAAGYRLATRPRAFVFPRDHASHPEYRLEWWYYTGHLTGAGRSFGYQLTFFRIGVDRARADSRSAWAPHTLVLAHAALTDETRQRFAYDERIGRAALGLAGADTSVYRVWVDDWRAGLAPDGQTHRLEAHAGDFALALDLTPAKPPVLHGEHGLSRKSGTPGNASHYVSLPRLETRGVVRAGRDSFPVRGSSWMDHEFGTTRLDQGQAGWDWFALQLETGEELMLYRMRRTDGSDDAFSSGTWVAADGGATPLARDAFAIEATGRWQSPASGARYPHGWTVRVPSHRLELTVAPAVDDQELVTRAGGIVYWEGSVRVAGMRAGAPVRGRGYVELTGYAGAPPGF